MPRRKAPEAAGRPNGQTPDHAAIGLTERPERDYSAPDEPDDLTCWFGVKVMAHYPALFSACWQCRAWAMGLIDLDGKPKEEGK